jgi:hypothetical protein
MKKQYPWFFMERACAFASLMLTTDHKVKVQRHTGRDVAINLLVEILKRGKSTLRFFGVQVIPYMDLPYIQNADEKVFFHRNRDKFEGGIPVCAFVIGVRNPEGIYRWVVEPLVDNNGARLNSDVDAYWQPLDEATATRLISQVNAWYDALNGNGTQKRRGRQVKTAS